MKTRMFAVVCASLLCCGLSPVEAASRAGYGQLVVKRSANFGFNLYADLDIDGQKVSQLIYGHGYVGTLRAGRHQLVVTVPFRRIDSHPAVAYIAIQPGRTVRLTAVWDGQDVALR